MIGTDIGQKSFKVEARVNFERAIRRDFNLNDRRLDFMRNGRLDMRDHIKRQRKQEREPGQAPSYSAAHDAHSHFPSRFVAAGISSRCWLAICPARTKYSL